jgi:hypothetical protein
MRKFIQQPAPRWALMLKILLSQLFFSWHKQIDQPAKQNEIAAEARMAPWPFKTN